MQSCEQTSGWTVLQHGESVNQMLEALIAHITEDLPLEGWRLPIWIATHGKHLAKSCHSLKIRHYYTVYHDCGKPICRQVDDDGRVHFPNHAQVSRETFQNSIHPDIDLRKSSDLIGWDMVLHTSNATEIDQFVQNTWTKEDAYTLLLAALAEIHSNAKLFGGIDSTNFKMKWKNIDRRGKQLIKHYFC